VRFLAGLPNSAVCFGTRIALITAATRSAATLFAGNPDVGLPPEQPDLALAVKKVGYSSTLVGKWPLGVLPNFGLSRVGTIISTDFAAERWTTFPTHWDVIRKILGDHVPIHKAGYLTGLLGDRAVTS